MPRRSSTPTAPEETAVTDTEKPADKKSMSDKPLEELPIRFKQAAGGREAREFVARTREAVIRLDASEDWERA